MTNHYHREYLYTNERDTVVNMGTLGGFIGMIGTYGLVVRPIDHVGEQDQLEGQITDLQTGPEGISSIDTAIRILASPEDDGVIHKLQITKAEKQEQITEIQKQIPNPLSNAAEMGIEFGGGALTGAVFAAMAYSFYKFNIAGRIRRARRNLLGAK